MINKIHGAIVEKGKILITVPDFEGSKKGNSFRDRKKIAENTFAPLSGPEKGLLPSFYTKEQAQKLFSKFKNL